MISPRSESPKRDDVVWDRPTGQLGGNALVWQDRRVAPLAADYGRDGGQDRFRARTGLLLASYFSAPKLRWLLENVADARGRAHPLSLRSARSTAGCCGT